MLFSNTTTLMLRYELILAAFSTSQLIMLDGSISSTILATGRLRIREIEDIYVLNEKAVLERKLF